MYSNNVCSQFKTTMTLTHLWNTNEDIFLSLFCPSIEGLCNQHFQASKMQNVYMDVLKNYESRMGKESEIMYFAVIFPVRFIDTVSRRDWDICKLYNSPMLL